MSEVTSTATVTISRDQFQRLQASARMLSALKRAGVDNWEGYDEAMRELYGDEKEDL